MSVKNCNCCGGKLVSLRWRDQFNGDCLKKCVSCEHIQVGTIPSSQEIEKFYETSYSDGRDSFVSERYHTLMKRRAASQVAFVRNHLENIESALDIGCGYGHLVECLTSTVCVADGWEFDPRCVDFCIGNFLKVTKLRSELDIVDRDFCVDVVFLSHVLEHFQNPDMVLESIRKKSKFIFIEVPAYSEHYPQQFLDQEGHLNFFNENGLRTFLEKRGYVIVDLVSCGPCMDLFWNQRRSFSRKALRLLKRDYFFNQYQVNNINGIWVRALVKGRE